MISLSALTFMRLVLYYSDVRIRLTGSNMTFAGRVEIFSYGVWGRIDGSSSWDRTEAEVVCRQLGFPGVVTALKYSPFGEGSGPVLMSYVSCTGSEKTLQQCQYRGWLESNVWEGREAGVICKTHELETDVRDISIRLQGSSIPNAGRVEVMYAGIWGAISRTNWDINDATVVCRQLGYQAGAEVALANGVYGPVSGPVWITNLQCSGSEADVMSCFHDGIGNKSGSQNPSNVASVICKNLFHANGMPVRLRGSTSPNMGRVEVYYAGIWGSIYGYPWDIRDATVVCRQLGYTTALLAGEQLFCSIIVPYFFRNFRCHGNESAIGQCAWDFFDYTSSSSYCANVVCSDGTADSGFDVRLTNSAVRHAGRVELRIHGIWGTLQLDPWHHHYDLSFDGVICRQLNFSDSILAVSWAVFGPGTGPQWYDTTDIQCLGDESSLQNCTYYYQPQLRPGYHDYDLSVICKPNNAQANDFKVRLTGSNLTFAGTIEVMYYGVWGGVLGAGQIDINAGHVVCRQLGYHSADEIFQYAAFGRLKGPLWIWSIHCKGNESNISDCTVTTWDNIAYGWIQSYLQRPRFAAGVLCRQANFKSSKMSNVRLAGSPISNAGRVEVFYLGDWGTVDNWGWDLNAAHVVCRQLGYPASLSSGYNNQFGSSAGPEWFRNVRCFGNETNLGECTKDVYGYISSGSRTITVLCKLPYQADISSKCLEVKCQHQGTCINTGGGAICNCTEGFTGIHCEKSISNPCQSSPCMNGGKCISNESSYICSCPVGLSGHRCEERTAITMKPCQSHPCPNNAFCHDNETHFYCVFNEAENSTFSQSGDGSLQKQNGSTTSKTTFIVTLSILASLVFLLIAAVVYLSFQNRKLSKLKPRDQQATFSNMAYRSDKEETYYSDEIDLGTGTNHSSMPTRDNTNHLYEIAPTFHETATSRPLPPTPPPHKAETKKPQAARKKANRGNDGLKAIGAVEGSKRATTGVGEHYMALSKENSSTASRNISADGGPNPNEYMSLSPNRHGDISHS